MALSLKEHLTSVLVPSALYYRRRIADEAAWGEHELAALESLAPRGGTAIDVGANDGVFAYAFSALANQVEAFEPNPDYALFARRMLRSRARVHEVALSNNMDTAQFTVPIAEDGAVLHLGGTLRGSAASHSKSLRFDVVVRTLDSYAFADVRVIKIDVEGSEMQVLDGGRETIGRYRPALIVELLTGTHADPIELTETICKTYGYASRLITKDGALVEAIPVMRSLGSNTTWGSPIRNRNVVFICQN